MSQTKKYRFTGETMQFEGHVLRRILFLRNCKLSVRTGDLGGWIETEDNLSHEGTCVVLSDAKVFGNAKIMEDAWINESAIVKDNAQIKGDSNIFGTAIVGADSILDGDTLVGGESKVFFYAQALDENSGKPNISGESRVVGQTIIEATGTIHDCMILSQKMFGSLNLNRKTMLPNKRIKKV